MFQFTEEQQLMIKAAKEFVAQELAPIAAELDEKGEFRRELYNRMAELGFTQIPFPEEYGGLGLDMRTFVSIIEQIAKVCNATAGCIATSVSLVAQAIYKFGTEEQKKKYLVPLVEGRTLGSFALTEPNAGTDASRQQTTAVLEGDEYVLNGSKIFITNGGDAETYVVFAMTDKSKGVKGISAFIVEKDTPGFAFGKKERKMGIRSSSTRELIFRNCRIPKENLLGKEGEGFKIAMTAIDNGRLAVAAQALGIAQGALEEAVRYAKEREQFGKPIAHFQGISFKLADMATAVEASRLLIYQACYLQDNNLPVTKLGAMAKMYASDTAMMVTTEAVQILGGYGYTKDFPVERFMRDAKITQIYEGTNEAQRMVIAANLLKEY